jgi:hypothetical protein
VRDAVLQRPPPPPPKRGACVGLARRARPDPTPPPRPRPQIKAYRKEIAELLRAGKQDYARIRVEAVIRESAALQVGAEGRAAP